MYVADWRKTKEKDEDKGDRLTTAQHEHGIRQPHDGEMPQVAHVHGMAGHADEGQPDGEVVQKGEQDLQRDDAVDEPGEQFLGQDGVFFNQFGQVV